MKVFISGPMSGKPLYNAHAFYNAERLLKECGFSVWNPAWQQYPDDTEFTRDDMHFIDNAALHMCDAIYMLEGWQKSDGARAEYELAKKLEKIIIHEAEFEKAKDIATNSFFGLTSAKFDSKPFKDFREEAAKKREALLEANLSHIMRQCNEFDEDIHELFDDMEDRKEDISEQDRRLDCHHNRLMSLTERVDTLTKQYKDSWYELQQVRKDVTDLVNTVCEDNRTINNTLTDFNIRLKAIEKRLSIKPFYEPTEDEKDDD